MFEKISVHDLMSSTVLLEPGESIDFHVFESNDGNTLGCAGITRIDVFEATHLLANYYGGGAPFLFDITIYDADLEELEEAFVEWLVDCAPYVMGNDSPVVLISADPDERTGGKE